MMRLADPLPEILLCREPIDFRKGIPGFSVLVEAELSQDPFARRLFVFINRTRTSLKMLYWERNGFCLWQKKLEQERFKWPRHLNDDLITLARWVIRAGQLIQSLLNLLQDRINEYDIQHMDETRIQVLKENDRVASAQSQMWVQRGGPPDETIIRYHYDPSRGRAVADRLLEGFQGYVQTDVHSAYQKLRPGIIQVRCWAHVRRKFNEALKAQPKGKHGGKAQMCLSFIQKLYAIEKRIADQTPEVRQ
jgi:transposase